jgi:hypothetical protein
VGIRAEEEVVAGLDCVRASRQKTGPTPGERIGCDSAPQRRDHEPRGAEATIPDLTVSERPTCSELASSSREAIVGPAPGSAALVLLRGP